MTDVRFSFRQCRRKTGQEDDSFAGQQNPTRGTTAFSDAIRGMGNVQEISDLRRAGAFGTAVAKRFRVADSTSRLHCIQFSLSLL